MKTRSEVVGILRRKYQNNRQAWFDEWCEGDEWSLSVPLNVPSEAEANSDYEKLRSWVGSWDQYRQARTVLWRECNWRSLGRQTLPERVVLSSPQEVADWIGEGKRWRKAVQRRDMLLDIEMWEGLATVLPKHIDELADYSDADMQRVVSVLEWLLAHPSSGLYIRQIPVEGVDTKWLEPRKGFVLDLLDAIRYNERKSGEDIYERCGLRTPPSLVRMRILDEALRHRFGGLGYIAAPVADLADLDIHPSTVFVIENDQSALSCGELQNAVVFMGGGNAVSRLGKIPWLHDARCLYWGDLDTDGMAILNTARGALPHIKSIMMDEDVLLRFRHLWVPDTKRTIASDLPLLTSSEQKVYKMLCDNSLGQAVSLEQERIPWSFAWEQLVAQAAA